MNVAAGGSLTLESPDLHVRARNVVFAVFVLQAGTESGDEQRRRLEGHRIAREGLGLQAEWQSCGVPRGGSWVGTSVDGAAVQVVEWLRRQVRATQVAS